MDKQKWIVVLEKTFESPLDNKEIKPVNPKGNQPWIFSGRTDAEVETLYFGHLMWRTDPLEIILMIGKIEGRRRRGWHATCGKLGFSTRNRTCAPCIRSRVLTPGPPRESHAIYLLNTHFFKNLLLHFPFSINHLVFLTCLPKFQRINHLGFPTCLPKFQRITGPCILTSVFLMHFKW